jgi:hypothetical protein
MPVVRGQCRPSPASRARLQCRQLPAHAGDARADQGLVADQPEREADQDRREGRQPRPLCRLPDGRGRRAEDAVRRDPAADRRTAATVAANPSMSIGSNNRWQPDGRGVSMNDRELPNAAARWGASLMTRVYAVSEAGSSPRRLAATGATAHDRPSEAGHPENPGLDKSCSSVYARRAHLNSSSSRLGAALLGAGPISPVDQPSKVRTIGRESNQSSSRVILRRLPPLLAAADRSLDRSTVLCGQSKAAARCR